LFDANGLRWRFQLHAVEVKMERSHLFNASLCLHINAIPMKLYMTSDLEVVLLLAYKSVVRIGEIEAFVGVDTEVRNWSEKGQRNRKSFFE
jgi:hypothetical protein